MTPPNHRTQRTRPSYSGCNCVRSWAASRFPRWAVVIPVALAWSHIVFGGEIHDAARDNDYGKVKALLKANPKLVSSKDQSSQTPLHWAAMYGHKPMVQLLLANKAEVSAETGGVTPLHGAATAGFKDVAELLLANKADVNAKARDGWTPLHRAALNGHLDVAKLLLANKADVNPKDGNNWTPLHLAALEGHKDVAKLLLANKADVNVRSNIGTPLHVAVVNGRKELVELLRQRGGHE